MVNLLTFLGTGRYEQTCYTWEQSRIQTCYVAEALIDLFKPEAVSVFMTTQAEESHWQNFKTTLGHKAVLQPISIPNARSEPEVWDIFSTVVSKVDSDSEIIFDITHAFRSIPFLVLLVIGFLRRAKNVDVRGVYYGLYERESLENPILDLTPAVTLFDWLTATDKFISTGSSTELGRLLRNVQANLHRQGAANRPTQLINLSNNIEAISLAIETIRGQDLIEQASRLKKLSTFRLLNELGAFARPFELIFDQIQADYGQFAIEEPNSSDDIKILNKQFLLIQWYTRQDLTTQAILMAREWIVSVLHLKSGYQYCDKHSRRDIEDQLNRLDSENSDLNQPVAAHVTQPEKLDELWSRLTTYRNDIAHAGERPHPASARAIQTYVRERLVQDLTNLFPDLA